MSSEHPLTADVLHRARRIQLLVLDVDGVLTDGKLYFTDAGETLKVFHVHDGLGIKLLRQASIEVGVVTSRAGAALDARLKELALEHVFSGIDDKSLAVDALMGHLHVTPDAVAAIGDDLVDLAMFARVGLAVATPDAPDYVQARAHFVTAHRGGEGAVREVCDLILSAQGKLDAAIGKYSA